MNRTQKQEWISSTNTNVKDANIVLVVHYKGLTVAEMTDLRVKVRAAGAAEAESLSVDDAAHLFVEL